MPFSAAPLTVVGVSAQAFEEYRLARAPAQGKCTRNCRCKNYTYRVPARGNASAKRSERAGGADPELSVLTSTVATTMVKLLATAAWESLAVPAGRFVGSRP
jgi:hypothetical protein